MQLVSHFLTCDKEYKTYKEFSEGCRLTAPKDFNFAYDIVDVYAEKEPSKKALVWCNDEGEERIFTFSDISRESKKAAAWLTLKGIKKGDTVLLILRRRYEWWILMIALHRIGAIGIPATDQLLKEDIEYRVNAAGVKMIITYNNAHLQDEIKHALPSCSTLKLLVTVGKKTDGFIPFHEEYENLPAEFPRPKGKAAITARDPMLIYFTSGTSGNPKMVVQDFTYPIGHIITAKYFQCVVEDGLHLTIAETGWAKATWGKIYGQWICGSAVFTYDMHMLKPDKMLQMIVKYGLTTFCAPPTVYRFLVHQDLSRYDLSKCTRFSTAGEALNDSVYNQWLTKTGKKIYEGYGQSESAVICANFMDYPIKAGSMGRANPIYDIHVLDEKNKEVATGQMGELCINVAEGHPYGILTGYYQNKQTAQDDYTEKAFEANMYHTGDNVYKDADGYYWFIGRKDDIIKSSGYRISPFEVESILLKHPAVLDCAVTGVKDEKRGMAVKATIVLADKFKDCDKKSMELQIASFAKENTPMYKCPRVYEFVPSLPTTISGKIKRAEIRQQDEERYS